jgi:hypothetical protein
MEKLNLREEEFHIDHNLNRVLGKCNLFKLHCYQHFTNAGLDRHGPLLDNIFHLGNSCCYVNVLKNMGSGKGFKFFSCLRTTISQYHHASRWYILPFFHVFLALKFDFMPGMVYFLLVSSNKIAMHICVLMTIM